MLDERHLVFQPRLPTAVLPIVSIVVPLVDVLLALPILLVMAALETGVEWTLVVTPLLVVLQLALMAGIAWLVSSVSVFFRDVPNLVAVVLQILFYMTPVFYGLRTVPDEYQWVLEAQPDDDARRGLPRGAARRAVAVGRALPLRRGPRRS